MSGDESRRIASSPNDALRLDVQDAQWKTRLSSMEAFTEWVKAQEEVAPETASILVQAIAIVPGWSEKNFQVIASAMLDIQKQYLLMQHHHLHI